MNKKIAFILGGFAILLSGAVVAQTIIIPQVQSLNPTADRVQVIPNGQPSAQSIYASPAQLATTSYSVIRTPTTTSAGDGYTSTFLNYQSDLILNPTVTMTYAYVTTAPNPSDGATECVFARPAVTTLYWTANTGQTLSNAATSISANSRTCLTYSLANLTWYRSM